MRGSPIQRLGGVVVVLFGGYILLAHVFGLIGAPLQTAPAAACSHKEAQLVDKGKGPTGKPWTVRGSVRDNVECDFWLLEMEFRPVTTERGMSRWGWGIPAEGHLSDSFTLESRDDSAAEGRVFYGVAGAAVSSIVIAMDKGPAIMVRPTLPRKGLRARLVWLRNLRYFMHFYPAGRHAKKVTLYSADGTVVEKLRGFEGEFDGPGV